MKSAFKIKHEDAGVSNDTNVLLEIGRYGFSILWFKKDPITIEGVATYNFPGDLTIEAIQEHVEDIISENKLADLTGLEIFYNFPESILIPAEFYQPDSAAGQLNLVYGVAPRSVVAHDIIQVDAVNNRQETLYNVYRVPLGIVEPFEKMANAKRRHSTSVQVKQPGTNVLQCTIFHNAIKVFLYNNNQLLIVQQFAYKTPADVVYHLLNTCEKYNVSPAEVSLNLDGMIDSNSSLYQEIYKYFLNVSFYTVADDIHLAAEFKEHPFHFISHLTELARCV